MELPVAPQPPTGVKQALTVPQSVLFTELSMQGNLRNFFKTAMQIDYEPEYVIYDNAAISWNYDSDDKFLLALHAGGSTTQAIGKFITAIETTARALDKVSRVVPPAVNRRPSVAQDLIDDLEEYWFAYKLHMTNLFTFWNVEFLLTTVLTKALTDIGRVDEVKQGLARFLRPYETNYFLLERKQLQRIARRFIENDPQVKTQKLTLDTASPALIKVLENHNSQFEFIFAPFNVGAPPPLEALLERLNEAVDNLGEGGNSRSLVKIGGDLFEDLPLDLRELGIFAQRFAFWKSERLDVCWLADARARSLYDEVSAQISVPLEDLLYMTSQEIVESLQFGSAVVDENVRSIRKQGYCLVLHNGTIGFYRSFREGEQGNEDVAASVGTVLQGVATSQGEAIGKARVIIDLKDLNQLESGDILVSTMTRPEMGAALDRAGAFITDEGGLTSHAAVISREMGKPCVIGIGNATRVIHSGMVLRVDGTNGTVTIIEMAE